MCEFGRDLKDMNSETICLDLMNDRRQCNRSQTPIIFVAAVRSGDLVKQLFIGTSPEHTQDIGVRQFHSCISGFAFFSGEHASWLAPPGERLRDAKKAKRVVSMLPDTSPWGSDGFEPTLPCIWFLHTRTKRIYSTVSIILNVMFASELTETQRYLEVKNDVKKE
jgi:hypothetical protein